MTGERGVEERHSVRDDVCSAFKIVDGNGYTLQGTGSGTGIRLSYRSNVTIKNFKIKERLVSALQTRI